MPTLYFFDVPSQHIKQFKGIYDPWRFKGGNIVGIRFIYFVHVQTGGALIKVPRNQVTTMTGTHSFGWIISKKLQDAL